MKINLLPHPQKTKRVIYKALNIIATIALILNASMVGAFIAPNEAYANGPDGTYTYEYVDHVNNPNGTSTWNYYVEEIGIAKQVSHLGIETCFSKEELNNGALISTNPSYDSIGDPSTAHEDAIKWEGSNGFTEGNGNESWNVSITFDQWYGVDPQGAIGIVKDGTLDNTGGSHGNPHLDFTIKGPNCDPIETEPEFNIKKYVKLEGTSEWKNWDENSLFVIAEPGDDVTFMIKLWNTGTGEGITDITDVITNGSDTLFSSITRTQPTNITLTNGATTEPGFTVGGATDGSTNYYVYTYPATVKDTQTNEGWYNAINTATATQNNDNSQAKVKTKFECDLKVEKDVSPIGDAKPGDELTYTITYENVGSAFCTGGGVKLYDELHGMTYKDGSAELISLINDADRNGGAPDSVEIYSNTFVGDTAYPTENTNSRLANLHEIGPGEKGVIELKAIIKDGPSCDEWEVWNTGWTNGNEIGSDVEFSSPKTSVITECPLSFIQGKKFNDKNANGTRNGGDTFMNDWTIRLYNDTWQQVGNDHTTGETGILGQYKFNNLDLGTYYVCEAQKDGWTQTKPNSVTNLSGANDEAPYCFEVDITTPGQEATGKQFGNYKLGDPTITLNKVVNNNHGGTAGINGFDLTIGTTPVTSGQTLNVIANTPYALNEKDLAGTGYEFVSITGEGCPETLGDTVTLDYEESIECTITNEDITPQLTLVKKVTNLDGGNNLAEEWTLTATGDGGFSETGVQNINPSINNATVGPKTVKANITYTLSESGPDGYSPSSWVCDGGTQNDDEITLDLAESATCTIINDDEIPTITLIKAVDYQYGGTTSINGFDLTIGTTPVTSGQTLNVIANTPYALNEKDLAGTGYEFVSITGEGCPANLGDTVTLVEGEDITCTITNKDLPGRIEGYKTDTQNNKLNGWEICLNNGNDCVITGDTNEGWSDGYYEFDNLSADSYIVYEIIQDGWTPINPGSGIHNSIVVTVGNTSHANFINQLNEFEVEIIKTAQATVIAGDQMTYTLDWSITGNTPIDAYVSDVLPINTTFVSSPTGTYDSNTNTVTWNLGTVIPNDNGIVTFVVAVASPLNNETIIENTGEICGTGYIVPEGKDELFNENGTTKCDYDDTTTTVESAPILGVEKINDNPVIAPTETINYEVFWSVAGNSQATNVTLSDLIPVEINIDESTISHLGTYDNGTRTITWNLGTHFPGDAGSVTYSATSIGSIPNGTQIVNIVKITSDETDPIFWEAESVTTVESSPFLTIDKSVEPTTFVNRGDLVTYTVVVTNTGTDTSINTILSDLLPAGFVYEDTGLATREWSLGDLLVGDSVTTTYIVLIGAEVEAGFYDNLAITWSDNHPNISDIATVEVRVPTVLAEEADPVLIIEKTVDKQFINPGDSVTYTVVITNVGDAQAEAVAINVKLQDILPAGFTFVDGTVTKTFSLGDLLHGESKTITYTAISNDTILAGDYENLAIAWADNHGNISDFVNVEVRLPLVLGEELPTTGGSAMQFLYVLAAGLVLLFTAYTLKLTVSKKE